MEQRMPRVATVAKILCGLIITGLIVNLQIDFFSSPGISAEEYVGFALFVITLVLAIYASLEREVPTLGNQPTLEEQIAAMESTPTKTGNSEFSNQQSSQTQNIISTIIGSKNEINQQEINSAIGTLSEGDIGLASSAIAAEFPAPHKYSENLNNYQNDNLSPVSLDSNNVPLPANTNLVSSDDDFAAADNLSLPNPKTTEDSEIEQIVVNDNDGSEFSKIDDLPDLSELLGDIESNNKNHIDVRLPDLDDLFDEEKEITVETPDLPDFDDMF